MSVTPVEFIRRSVGAFDVLADHRLVGNLYYSLDQRLWIWAIPDHSGFAWNINDAKRLIRRHLRK